MKIKQWELKSEHQQKDQQKKIPIDQVQLSWNMIATKVKSDVWAKKGENI